MALLHQAESQRFFTKQKPLKDHHPLLWAFPKLSVSQLHQLRVDKASGVSREPAALGLAMSARAGGAPACPEGAFPAELRSWRVLHTLLLGMGNVAATLENNLAVLLKVKHRVIT